MMINEYANIFPMMNEKEFSELKKDIQENGLMDPIVTYNNTILDGRNRFNACKEVGIEPKFEEYEGNDPLQYVISTNLKRRHLNDNQRCCIGVCIAKLERGRPINTPNGVLPTEKETASMLNVPVRSLQKAKEVQRKAPERLKEIESGEKKLGKVLREIHIEEQKKEIEELNKNPPEELKGKYDVIVIDPPWKYEGSYDPDSRRGTPPYPTMELSELSNLNIPAKDNCIMFLWTTHRFIWEAKKLLEEWGFEYKALMVWDKDKMGLGVWLRMQCEFCLVATKGKPLIELSDQRDIIREARTTHSTKPEAFYNMVDKLCVGNKLDYFNKGRIRKGWDSYGN